VILAHERRAGLLGIARYATGFTPIASSLESICEVHQMPYSVAAQVAGRSRVVFLRHILWKRASKERWLRANAVVSQ
jgi:hypothetical protein